LMCLDPGDLTKTPQNSTGNNSYFNH
jgi:hypothetical protein